MGIEIQRGTERWRVRDGKRNTEREMEREIQTQRGEIQRERERERETAIPYICTHPVEHEINADCHLYRHGD